MSYNQDRDGDRYGSTRNNYSQDDSSSNNYEPNDRSGSLPTHEIYEGRWQSR